MSPAPAELRIEDHRISQVRAARALPVALTGRPRLSWVVPAVRQGQRQRAYQIRAARQGDPRAHGDVWDSGRVEADNCAHVRWAGPRIPAHSGLRWSVRTWDEHDHVSPWADPADLVTGPFTEQDWTASWIEVRPTHAARLEFELSGPARSARLHFAGHGLLRAYLDGRAVNPDASDCSRTALTRVTSRSYDVTDLVDRGSNNHVMSFAVGIGHYRLVRTAVAMLAELVLELETGTVVRIGTGPSWREGPTSVLIEDPFYLEERDARITDSWSAAGFDDAGWSRVRPPSPELPTVVPDAGPPIAVVETIATIRMPHRDAVVFDVGTNVAGRSRVVVRGATAGTRIEVEHGEKLDADGHVNTFNLRMPDDLDRRRQVVAVTCAGGEDVAEAWFAYHGFRYVEVIGVPNGVEVEVTARVLHSEVGRIATFSSDDPLLDRLVEAAARTQLNNTHGHPEDCPTREQGGWTGDASVSAEAALAQLDMAGVYRNWLGDVRADQRPDGGVLGLSPHRDRIELVQPPDPVWGAAMTEIPLQHWRYVGDASLIQENLPAMRRWCDWQLRTLVDGVVRRADISYGADWLALERTPPVLLQTAATLTSLRALAELEAAVGDPAQAVLRATQADRLRESARAKLRDPITGEWANTSQGSSGWALTAGLAHGSDERRDLGNGLRADVHAHGDRLSSGFGATQAVVRALAAADGGTALLAAVHQAEPPGIGAMLTRGPGTLWETWWIDDENAGVASLDHIGLAAPFSAWVWRDVAGIRPLTRGYARVAVAPRLIAGVSRVDAEVETPRGRLAVSWRLHGDMIALVLQIPVGAVAVVALPGVDPSAVEVDGRLENPIAGLTADGMVLGAGRYRLRATGVIVTPARAAIGQARDVRPGGEIALPVLRPGGADYRVAVDVGWSASLVGDQVRVSAPPDSAPGTTAVVSLHGESDTCRTLRVGVGEQWLSDGALAPGWTVDDGAIVVEHTNHVCDPVLHAQVAPPILHVTGGPLVEAQTRWVRLRFDEDQDLTQAAFVFADFELCLAGRPGCTLVPTIALIAAGGQRRQATERPLPASWNRVTLDVHDWPARRHVVEVAVGLAWSAKPDVGRGTLAAIDGDDGSLPFFVGRVGWTSAPRTW